MRLNFSSPPKNKIIVFDGESLTDLKYILENHKYFVLENRKYRINYIYCGPKFLLYYLLNFIKLFFKNRNLHTVYLYTLIKIINPKIIVTSIDNSFKFSDLAKLLKKKIKFVAIQNANRFDYAVNDYLFMKKIIKKDLNKIFYNIPNLCCFGQDEIDNAKKYNLNIKNFFKVGSIRIANFFRYLEINKFKLNVEKYDICLISEPQPGLNARLRSQDIEESFILPVKFTIKYVKNHNLKFVFAQKSIYNSTRNLEEINFLKKYLTKEEFEFLLNNSPKKKDFYSSYLHLFQSKIAIGFTSTLLRSKLGCKEKILSVNCSSEGIFDFPINGICVLKSNYFNDFSSRVSKILKMNIEEYLKELEKPTEYVMAFDKKVSTINQINNLFFKNN